MVHNNIYERVLVIGPEYRNHRGGIGAVIECYSQNFKPFHYICSYKNKNLLYNFFSFGILLIFIFFKLMFSRGIEIVHLHSASRGSFYRKYILFIICKYVFNKKVILHMHGSKFHIFFTNLTARNKYIMKNIVIHFIENCDAFFCLSESWKKYFELNFSIKKLYILNNPVQLPTFIPKRGLENKKVTFLFLGMICERKGIFDLLNVLVEIINEGFRNFELIVGGNGEIEKFLKLVDDFGLRDYVKFKGWVNSEAKIDCLNFCDVYILPSYNEGLPISILEAMSYGLPIISTTVGGIPEIVHQNENGLLISPGDKEDLKMSILYFIQNFAQIKLMGKCSEQLVKPYYPSNVFPKLIKIYNSLI